MVPELFQNNRCSSVRVIKTLPSQKYESDGREDAGSFLTEAVTGNVYSQPKFTGAAGYGTGHQRLSSLLVEIHKDYITGKNKKSPALRYEIKENTY